MAEPPQPTYLRRDRAESFGTVAEDYDRYRPSYPAALIDDLAALAPGTVLDVGCGTGKAGRLLAARGLDVLGVEVDPAMAAVARGHGLAVEVAAFESWDPAGRTFELVVCGQAWHWLDPEVAIPKAAGLLAPRRPAGTSPDRAGGYIGAGTLALFWNYDELLPDTLSAVEPVYRRLAPELLESVVLGDNRQDQRPHADLLRASGRFADVTTRTYRWDWARPAADWLRMVATHSDHLVLPAARRERLLGELAAALSREGAEVFSRYGTYAVLARVPA